MAEAANISIDDAILVERCRGGDSAAMEQLIIKYQNRIYNLILKMCANVDDAAELTQETFVKVIENIDTFRARSSFYTWVFRIAINLTLNYCQRRDRAGYKSLDVQYDKYNNGAKQMLKQFLSDDSSVDPAVVAANRELSDMVWDCLMKLDERQRAVVILRDIEGMNYSQIGQVLDIELGTVKSRLSRARSNLRQFLETVL